LPLLQFVVVRLSAAPKHSRTTGTKEIFVLPTYQLGDQIANSGRASPSSTKKKGEAQPMEQLIFKSCDKNITSPPIFRTTPNHLPCACCGSSERKLGAGKQPHSASLRCAVCDRFIRWIGKSELAKFENQGEQF